jgi:hypothetical protein
LLIACGAVSSNTSLRIGPAVDMVYAAISTPVKSL